MYLFIDPGETTGWAKFDNNGEMCGIGQRKGFESLCVWLNEEINQSNCFLIKRVVIEEFKLYPWKSIAQAWSEFFTVEVIGAVRAICFKFSIPFEKVPAKNYSMGFLYMGMEVPPHSHRLHDQMVAQAHGVYWLQTHGIRKPQQGRVK